MVMQTADTRETVDDQAETPLVSGDQARAPFDAGHGYRAVRLVAASGILLTTGALAAALCSKAPIGGRTGESHTSEGQAVRLIHTKDPTEKAPWNDEDNIEMMVDPCKRRKLRRLKGTVDLDAFKDIEKMDDFDIWDPCEVSKEAAVKAEKMFKQAAHWELHQKTKSSSDPDDTAAAKKDAQTAKASTPKDTAAKKGAMAAKASTPKNAAAKTGANVAKASTGHTVHSSTASDQTEKFNKTEKVQKDHHCAGPAEDCSKSKCCSVAGMQCFAKNTAWAECRDSCAPGPDPSNEDSAPWSCEKIGERTAGKVPQCMQNGVNCMDSKCCDEAGSTCFKKNETFATCRHYCTPGPDYTHEDWGAWTCEELGARKAGKAKWVETECSEDEEDCTSTRCCKTSGHQCYEKAEGWAQCKAECSEEPDHDSVGGRWTCKKLGFRTPWPVPGWSPGPEGGKVAPWVRDHCSDTGSEDCSKTQCCRAVGAQCYMKAKGWAVCKESCTPGPNPNDNGDNWTCDTLGKRSYGLPVKGWPSLFCFIVMRTQGYELPLVQAMWEARSGVFNCDGFVVFSDKVIDIAETKSLQTPNIAVGISKDGTAGNTALFMAIWDMLFEDGRVWLHDWTIKADPDAVLLPDRMRHHLAPHTGWGEHDGKLYIVNCNAWPSSPSFPMLYGAVEVFSMKAMEAYRQHVSKCKDELPWSDWGEDFFLTRCMDQIGVGRLLDFTLVGDQLCVGPGQGGAGDCDSAERAAFHPFKKFDDWMNCFNKAIGRV